MTALRAYHILHGLDTNPFKDERLALYLKSLRIQAPLAPARRLVVDVQLLTEIVQACDVLSSQQYLSLCICFAFSLC